MRYFLLGYILLAVLVVAVAGRRGSMSRNPPFEIFPDMDRQPKLRPQTVNAFFTNGMSSQLPVAGTVARGSLYEENVLTTGKIAGTTNWVETNALPITATLLARGQERFNINCSPCHGAAGDGKGITTKLGMGVIADLHDPKPPRRVVQQPDGEIFNTITFGKNLMGPYGPNVSVEDRWAIVAYVRALQRSHLASLEDVPGDVREILSRPMPPGAGTPATNAPAKK
jgi:mono/diheme cytochrome c family protein